MTVATHRARRPRASRAPQPTWCPRRPPAVRHGVVIRALRPAAARITVHLDDGSTAELEPIHPGGVFEGTVDGAEAAAALPARGRLRERRHVHDRGPLRVPADARRARPASDRRGPPRGDLREARRPRPRNRATHRTASPALRSRSGRRRRARSASSATSTRGTAGCTRCARWARSGIWELFLPGLEPGARYKYEILTQDHELLLKADPYAQEAERPPKTASVITQPHHRWSDGDAAWLARAPRAAAARRARCRSTRSTSGPGG